MEHHRRLCCVFIITICSILTVDAWADKANSPSSNSLAQALENIRSSDESNIRDRIEVLARLSQDFDILPILQRQLEETAPTAYIQRGLIISVLGELQDPRSLPVFLEILAEPQAPARPHGHLLSMGDGLTTIQIKATHGIGFLRTESARKVLIRTMQEHISQPVRVEAIATYLWNSRDRSATTKYLYEILPPAVHIYVDMPRYYNGMDHEVFRDELSRWRAKWIK